jgi:uroporphyrinogen decarboxylase
VESEEDALNLEVPDVANSGIVPVVTEFNKLAVQKRLDGEHFDLMVPLGGPFTFAGNICGVERFLKWVMKRPETAHHLLRLSTDYSLGLFQYWKDMFGTEGLLPFIGEPSASNQLIAPKQFEEFVLPYLKELHEKVLSMGYRHIYCHICGEANGNLPFWSQVPMGDPGIVSIGHEIDILTAAEYFPEDIIMGNLETTIIHTGTPHEVYEASKVIIEKGKKCPGGFAFSPGCELPPMAPPLNVWMMTKAANDAGWFG